jgi:hypothetical protein
MPLLHGHFNNLYVNKTQQGLGEATVAAAASEADRKTAKQDAARAQRDLASLRDQLVKVWV